MLDPGTRVLAAIDDSPAAAPVLAFAAAVATLLGDAVDAFHVREGDKTTAARVAEHVDVALRVVDGDPIIQIAEAAADPAVSLVVIGSRGHATGAHPAGHVTYAVLQQTDKPVLVVPPDVDPSHPEHPIRRALFPLQGTAQTSDAVAATRRRLSDAGMQLVGVHVFDATTAPAYWDQSAHAEESWAMQFAANWCAGDDIDLHLRRGSAADTVVDIANEQGVDLIALGWSQDISPGHAAVVQATLSKARIPVLLVPTPPSPG